MQTLKVMAFLLAKDLAETGGLHCGMRKNTKLASHIIYASKAQKIAKASRLGIIVSAVLTFLVFSISYYGTQVGNFTFTVDGFARNAGIAMYEYANNKEYKTRIVSNKVEDNFGMTAYCGTEYYDGAYGTDVCMPLDEDVVSIDGPSNGTAYIAHTFYVENAGEKKLDMEASVNILSAYRGAEEALRVRVLINGFGSTYAKVQSGNGSFPGMVEPLTESFYSIDKVYHEEFLGLNPGDFIKVTVMVWFEGVDPDHTNELYGGGVKLDMQFSVTEVYDEF
jgi:hypothetical protein